MTEWKNWPDGIYEEINKLDRTVVTLILIGILEGIIIIGLIWKIIT